MQVGSVRVCRMKELIQHVTELPAIGAACQQHEQAPGRITHDPETSLHRRMRCEEISRLTIATSFRITLLGPWF